MSETESTAWESGLVPCMYLFCERDKGLFPKDQERLLEMVQAESPRPWKVVKVDASHSVWLSRPEVVTGLIEELAKGE